MSLNQIPDFMLSDEAGSVKDKIAVLSGAGGAVEKTNKSEFDAYKVETATELVILKKGEVYVEDYVGTDTEKITSALIDLVNGGTLYFSGKAYAFTGIIINKPVNLKGAGTSLTTFTNTGTGRMITYDYSVGGLSDVGKRRPIQVSDVTIIDSIVGTGTGIYVFKAYFIEFNRCFFTGFTSGYGIHLDAVLWSYLNNVSTDKSEIRCVDTLVPHSNNQIFFNGGEYRNPTTHAIYIENADTVGARDLTVEGYSGTPTVGVMVKNATTTILEELYIEHLEGAQACVTLENCRALSVKSALISSNLEGVPALNLINTSITEIEKCSLSVDPIKADANCQGIKIRDTLLYGKLDIAEGVYFTLENCEPASATVMVKNPQFQPENFNGYGIPFSNRMVDSSFRSGIPVVTQSVGLPVTTHDTTVGYYDLNSLKIVGVANDKALIDALGRIELLGQGAIISFMAKSDNEADFTFSPSIAVASGSNKAKVTTGWRRYFVHSLIQGTQTAFATVKLWITFSNTNTIWIDDVMVIPINSYKESCKYVDNFRYLHTHGTEILADTKAVVPFVPYFDAGIRLRKQTYAPVTPLEGMVYFADGTSWNPGGTGKGLYFYDGSAYSKM